MITDKKVVRFKNRVASKQFISLLVIQPTPFCNINCDYCYLPHRNSTKRMPISTLKQTMEKVFTSNLVGERLSIVWHAGEPLALPISFYEEAFETINCFSTPEKTITHSFQSNGTLINDEWCELINKHHISLGLSIDGPDFIHDAHRKTRRGSGTHAKIMANIELLRKHNIDFHVIAVITEQSLNHPDEIFNFFLENGIQRVGFNIEEIEGVNKDSTLNKTNIETKIRDFLQRIYYLQKKANGAINIREFDRAFHAIAQNPTSDELETSELNDQVTPFKIFSVDCDGNFSTFSPELLGVRSLKHKNFYFGNVLTDDLYLAKNNKFRKVFSDIKKGVKLCSESCDYFFLCGGGAPSNKYFENGSFASTETMYCRYTIKIPIDIVLADLEEALNIRSGRDYFSQDLLPFHKQQ